MRSHIRNKQYQKDENQTSYNSIYYNNDDKIVYLFLERISHLLSFSIFDQIKSKRGIYLSRILGIFSAEK